MNSKPSSPTSVPDSLGSTAASSSEDTCTSSQQSSSLPESSGRTDRQQEAATEPAQTHSENQTRSRPKSVHYRSTKSTSFEFNARRNPSNPTDSRNPITPLSPTARSATTGLVVTDLLKLRIALDQCTRLDDACQVLAEAICNIITCPNAFVSVFRKSRPCLLGQETADSQQKLKNSLLSAQQEVSDQQPTLGWPATNHWTPSVIHRELTNESYPAAVSFLFKDKQGNALGIVTINSDKASCVAATEKMKHVLDLVSPHLQLLQQASLSLLDRIQNSFQASIRLGLKWALAICMVITLFFIPMPLHLHCSTETKPVFRRYVSAPFESVLKKSLVQAGDFVTAGAPLARLDEDEIRLQQSSVEAEKAKYWKQKSAALADGDPLASQQAQLEYQRLDFKNQLLKQRNENLEIVSPISGVVLTDELEDAEGAPLTQGQVLFEIAPLEKMTFWVYVSQQDIAYVTEGMQVRIFMDVLQQSFEGVIQRIRPEAITHENESVFVAEVGFENDKELVRPGMRGYAIIKSREHSIGWILFRKPYGYFKRILGL